MITTVTIVSCDACACTFKHDNGGYNPLNPTTARLKASLYGWAFTDKREDRCPDCRFLRPGEVL